jgi:hypothetical protein
VAVTATCAEVGVLGGQRSCLDPVDGIGVGILGSDGSAALALADKRTLAAAVSMPHSASSSVLRRIKAGLTVASGSYSLDSFCM